MFNKLYKLLLLFCAGITLLGQNCNGEILLQENDLVSEEVTTLSADTNDIDIENAIQKIVTLSLTAEKNSEMGIVPPGDTEKFYNHMIAAVDDITKLIKKSDNVYKFIRAKGIVRILSNNLMLTNTNLRTKLLLLLKYIFDIAPTTTKALIPLNIVDRLLDIFENDDNLAQKAHALDILCKWLPNNPKAQIRVMKIKELETFYDQIDKLDSGVVQTLMELFSKILKEHLAARNDKAQVTKDDGEKLVMYQRIGLLERMSTPNVCNGLLNIFEMLWFFNNNQSDESIKTVLELIKDVQPFCSKMFKKKSKAIDLFEALLKYVKNENKKEYFEQHDVNVSDYKMVIEDYLDEKYLSAKDEF